MGGCLTFTPAPSAGMDRLGTDGGIERIARFSEDVLRVESRGDLVIFITSNGREDRVWFAPLSGRPMFNWQTRGNHTFVEWAASAPVALVTGVGFHAAFDFRHLQVQRDSPLNATNARW